MALAPLSATGRTEISTDGDGSILDLSDSIGEFLEVHESWNGILVVFVPGSTAGITTIEYESGALEDLRRAIETVAPRGSDYAHDRRWGDGNGFSHVRAALMGPSLAIPVERGKTILGTWQQVVLCDFDNRPRRRTVIMQFTGSTADEARQD
jgi:secondary thiamine-phosphate synthase enzyme